MMTEEIIIDVNECPHKRDDDCMEVPICNEYGDLMGYQSCEAQTLCPYRSQKKIERLEQLKNKYYQQTLDDEIQINNLLEEIQQIKQDRNVQNITRLSLENTRLEQENKELKIVKEQLKKWNDENLKRQDDMQLWIDLAEEQRRKYRSALEEINRILLGVRGLSINCDKQIIKVKAIINEVLK